MMLTLSCNNICTVHATFVVCKCLLWHSLFPVTVRLCSLVVLFGSVELPGIARLGGLEPSIPCWVSPTSSPITSSRVPSEMQLLCM